MTYRALFLIALFGCLTFFAFPGSADARLFRDTPNFVSLTGIPGVEEAATANNLAALFNIIYRLAIGIAAVLAVIQIIRGGIIYMLGTTSIVEKREATHHIQLALFGLLLVLSPTIVFGLIDPRILSLQVNTSQLAPRESAADRAWNEAAQMDGQRLTSQEQEEACRAQRDEANGRFCQVVVVNQGTTNEYRECRCEERTQEDTPAEGASAICGAGKSINSNNQFVYFASTQRPLTEDERVFRGETRTIEMCPVGGVCLMSWGGVFASETECTARKAIIERAHGNEQGFRVVKDCIRASGNLDVGRGYCTNTPLGDFGL